MTQRSKQGEGPPPERGSRPGEGREARLRRLALRSWRRGIKEMDVILGPWADAHLAALGEERLDLYESLLLQSDQDLYAWVSGRAEPPAALAPLLAEIAAHARARAAARGG